MNKKIMVKGLSELLGWDCYDDDIKVDSIKMEGSVAQISNNYYMGTQHYFPHKVNSDMTIKIITNRVVMLNHFVGTLVVWPDVNTTSCFVVSNSRIISCETIIEYGEDDCVVICVGLDHYESSNEEYVFPIDYKLEKLGL